ncbi:MAG: hypothetical protein WCW13_02460 [archaeon]|jgi:predicted nucleotidyltransferase
MEFDFKGNEIVFDRELSNLDKLVLKFVKVLDKEKVDYVIISGYIAILFGRSRGTEDVDLFIEEMSLGKFNELWTAFNANGFECINTSDSKEAYENFLRDKTSIRFAEKGEFMPNFELKFPTEELSKYSLNNKIKVVLNNMVLNTSKIEPQIAYKLYLGSEKDLEDATHLWQVFKQHLDRALFNKFAEKLNVTKLIKKLE